MKGSTSAFYACRRQIQKPVVMSEQVLQAWMKTLILKAKQKKHFVITTDNKYAELIADNLFDRKFNLSEMN